MNNSRINERKRKMIYSSRRRITILLKEWEKLENIKFFYC